MTLSLNAPQSPPQSRLKGEHHLPAYSTASSPSARSSLHTCVLNVSAGGEEYWSLSGEGVSHPWGDCLPCLISSFGLIWLYTCVPPAKSTHTTAKVWSVSLWIIMLVGLVLSSFQLHTPSVAAAAITPDGHWEGGAGQYTLDELLQ